MNYRKAIMLTAEACVASATKIVEFKGKEVISRIQIQLKLTNNGSTPTAHPATAINKIEIVDGSEVLWSLSGKECQALNFYSQEKQAIDLINYVDNEMAVPMMNINFGRWLWDEELAFDPTRFNNPQLKITYTLASGGSAPDAGTLEVVADIFDEIKPSPIGFLMAKEYYSYTLVANSTHRIDMPTDYPIRMLMIASLAAGKQPWEQYNQIKISEENDKRIPLDDKTSDLIKYILDEFGTYEELMRAILTTSDVVHYTAPTFDVNPVFNPCNGETLYPILGLSYGGTFAIKGSAAGQVKGVVKGYMPHGAMAIPFGDIWDANKWYDVTKLGGWELIIVAGSGCTTSSTCQIVTEQLRRY